MSEWDPLLDRYVEACRQAMACDEALHLKREQGRAQLEGLKAAYVEACLRQIHLEAELKAAGVPNHLVELARDFVTLPLGSVC